MFFQHENIFLKQYESIFNTLQVLRIVNKMLCCDKEFFFVLKTLLVKYRFLCAYISFLRE